MFKKVETTKELNTARHLHRVIFEEKNFVVEEINPEAIQYLFYEEDKAIGLVEFIPYHPEIFTTIENDFAFSEINDIQCHQGTTWEVDKLGLFPEYRKKGYMNAIIDCLAYHAVVYGATRYVALLDALFFRMLQIAYRKYPIKKVGKTFTVTGEKSKSVPVIVDMEKSIQIYMRDNKDRVKI
ncbi:hypothetical protein PUS82_05385 [Cytobacillus firmus]|uniref:GNAT family N-acetyltransferase n=1 Tax=Cytobacillus firmus TaxID=1399 RepID=UPI00237B9EC8|nr:GNAT family N-acetyltransferase [Cytobacillus firmus]MDD9310736.1 hypothetical protein [Cytobacillus firmus]